MITVTLYTKTNCSLCDQVKQLLVELAPQYPHTLREVDITQDEQLFALYRYTIPVVTIGSEQLQAPIDKQMLEQALATAE
jgi:glutaredoxin